MSLDASRAPRPAPHRDSTPGLALAWTVWMVLLATLGPTSGIPILGPAEARASTEEFSTFDVAAQEEDDESLLDHYMLRSPYAWRDEWEHAPQAIRTSQGCLTSGQWFIDTDLKLRTDLGRRAKFGLDLRQAESDAASYDYLDFSIHFPTRWGTPGAMFRPTYDKSRQDFAATWEVGADTSALQIQTAFTFEDMFNNLWAWRQTRVGNDSEPYERHPYEPGARLVTRHEHWRFEVSGLYLTPSRKLVLAYSQGLPPRRVTLWGTLGGASLEARALGFESELRFANQQTLSTDQLIDLSSGDQHDFRRKWSGEVALRRRVIPRLTVGTRWLYQERTQLYGPPYGPGEFRGVDRLEVLELDYAIQPRVTARAGGLFDRVTVLQRGHTPFSYGTRNESRAYVGLLARFGRVSVSAVEGIELDPEPYDVWFVHDKGFVHLQTTF